jgi:hypothetical protein
MPISTDELVAREEIRDVLFRYTRGIDRLDLDLVRSCYHADAHDNHGAFRGDVDGFLDWVGDALSYFDSTMHVDRLERRADRRWKIADRVCVFDWSRRDPVADQWAMDGAVRGRRGPDDPVWHR